MKNVKSEARVLDPFRRLALMKAREKGRPLVRTELHELLTSQIFGIDIERGAIQVCAFSLYLALLELDPDPQPPSALKFPKLVNPEPNNKRLPNLYVQDVFNHEHLFNQNEPFSEQKFHLIVSNPPWTALTEDDASRDPDDPEKGRQWGLEYCKQHQIPDRKPDQALFAIVQGGLNPGWRVECAEALAAMDFPGYALGGFSVGEPTEQMLTVLAESTAPL
ncbi:tRNA-guanine transglycosylase, partial [candidate division KSB1 bacterium]|nr:tRNA-guanine transglycosylase [candidate division KSB1 bacterium]